MIIRFSVRRILLVVVVIVLAAFAYYFFLSGHISAAPQTPADVRYALEYFNAVESNKTIIVPPSYYKIASELAINGNKVVSDAAEYAGILFGNKSLPKRDFILVDMAQLDQLGSLSKASGLNLSYDIVSFPPSYYQANLSNSERNCLVYKNVSSYFAFCGVYLDNVKIAYIGMIKFPGSSTEYEINSTVFYNGIHRYLFKSIATNNSNEKHGIALVYQNITTLYFPQNITKTFFGKEMLLPSSELNNVFDNYGEARIIS